jgi:hypothetical protein
MSSARITIKVLTQEEVSHDAVGLPRVESRCPDSSKDVLPLRDWFEMFRIHTPTDATQVIELESFANRAD